jgi:endonuclease YncB( thermonuclease family)
MPGLGLANGRPHEISGEGWLGMRFLLALLILIVGLPALPRAAEITSYAIVRDDGSLRMRGRIFRLFGTHIPDSSRFCRGNFSPVLCGTRASTALEMRIQGFVSCDPQAQFRDGSIAAFCYVPGRSTLDPPVDLGAFLIEQGLAVATPDAPFEYGVLERIARTNGRGVWGFQVDGIRRR